MSKTRAYAAWIVVCLIWGTTYLAIRVAIDSIPPLLMAGVRWIIAATLLIAFFRLRGERLPDQSTWLSLAIRGVLLIGFGNGAVVWAEQTVPSGLASVFVAVAPFWMVGVEALFGDGDPLAGRQLAGLLVGFSGIVTLIYPQLGIGLTDVRGGGFLSGFLATQLACAGWAVGSSFARRVGRSGQEPALTAPALEMLFGGVVLLLCALAIGERTNAMITARSIVAVAYLVFFGSIVAFSSYRYALGHLPVATVSLYVYVNTVIALLLGTLVLGEPFSWRMAVGAAVVLAGIWMVKGRDG